MPFDFPYKPKELWDWEIIMHVKLRVDEQVSLLYSQFFFWIS